MIDITDTNEISTNINTSNDELADIIDTPALEIANQELLDISDTSVNADDAPSYLDSILDLFNSYSYEAKYAVLTVANLTLVGLSSISAFNFLTPIFYVTSATHLGLTVSEFVNFFTPMQEYNDNDIHNNDPDNSMSWIQVHQNTFKIVSFISIPCSIISLSLTSSTETFQTAISILDFLSTSNVCANLITFTTGPLAVSASVAFAAAYEGGKFCYNLMADDSF